MFFGSDYRAERCRLRKNLLIERLNCMHVYDSRVDPGSGKVFRGHDRFVYHNTCGNDGDVTAAAEPVAFPEAYIVILTVKYRYGCSSKPYIAWAVHFDDLFHQFFTGNSVARIYYRHTRYRPHQRDVLKGLVARPVFAHSYPRVGGAYLHIGMGVAYGISDY